MDEEMMIALSALRHRIFCAQRDLVEYCGGYKRVMEKTGKSKSEVNRWQGGADQDFMPMLVVYLLERDCKKFLITTVMADAQGCKLTDPDEERVSQVNLHRAYAESVRRRADIDNAYAAALEDDGLISPSEATVLGRALSASERANSELHGAVSLIKARGGADLRVVEG